MNDCNFPLTAYNSAVGSTASRNCSGTDLSGKRRIPENVQVASLEKFTTYIDGYCERLEPGFLAEPFNAATNFVFIIAAAVIFARPDTRRYPLTVILTALLCAIGISSLLFHTFANRITMVADVTSIALFVLTYLYASNRCFLRMNRLPALAVTLLFFPYEWLAVIVISELFPWIGGSTGYVPIALLILGYSVLLRRRLPAVSRDLGIGFLLLAVSILFRWLDEPICSLVPVGTHFIWHILNAVLLAWMIRAVAAHLSRGGIPMTPAEDTRETGGSG